MRRPIRNSRFDPMTIIIIGAGPGGYETALAARRQGLDVILVESGQVGGTCLNAGCIPTKAYCRTAEILEEMRHAGAFGISAGQPTLDFAQVKRRKDDIVSGLRSNVETLLESSGVQLVRGQASFKDHRTVTVCGTDYTADYIIIAAGSVPAVPDIPGIGLDGVVDSTALLELEELRSNVVGAQLGEQAISTSLMAGAIGLAIIFVFMIFVYYLPGLASSLALIIYTELVLVILNAFDVTLTLQGIAGIILSIGMAVDANVIIFARVKEEMSRGISVRNALKAGFHKALSAIVDGNVTTLIAAAVLWFLGSGSVKGFAQTLAIGIIVSMFTALVITRMIVYAFYAVGIRNPKIYYRPKKEREPINFLGRKKIFFSVSLAVILLGFVVMGVNHGRGEGAFAYSLDFQGGTSTNVTFNEDYSIDEIDQEIVPVVEEVTGDANVQTQKVDGTNQVIIKTVTLDLDQREALNQALAENFGVDESKITAENISSTVSNEMRQDAVVAVLVAGVFMLLYIWFRFKDIRFATSAVAALLHDVLVVVGFYAVSRIAVGSTFIACMLTLVGYSINATIVIFDRIREELHYRTKTTELSYVVNKSITQTLTRSIYTSLTTFISIAVLYVLGVSSIKEFALPLMIGIVVGAYSSVCITGALWYVMKTRSEKKKQK